MPSEKESKLRKKLPRNKSFDKLRTGHCGLNIKQRILFFLCKSFLSIFVIFLDDGDFFFCQVVKFVDHLVNLSLEEILQDLRHCGGKLFVHREYCFGRVHLERNAISLIVSRSRVVGRI